MPTRSHRFHLVATFALLLASIGIYVTDLDSFFIVSRRHLKIDDESREIRKALRKLRIVTFGASRTWGAGLGNNRFKAYPYLLSRNTSNKAIRASGPDYPALCTYSMVKDEIYDVIILEFYLDAHQKLLRLAQRLRQRFPEATIIFLRIWGPLQFKFLPNNEGGGLKWFLQNNSLQDIHSPEYHTAITEQTDPSEWEFAEGPIMMQEEARGAVEGHYFVMPMPEDPIVALRNKAYMFSEDLVHLSVDGHKEVARGIKNLLLEVNATRSDKVNPWGNTDFCESWYETGESNIVREGMEMKRFATDPKGVKVSNGKWALETSRKTLSWIEVNNDSGGNAEVYLRYMGMGPPEINKYPQVKVILTRAMYIKDGATFVSPIVNDNSHHVHVNRVTSLGMIPPGVSKILIYPLSTDYEWNFRVTGVIVTPSDKPFQISKFLSSQSVRS